MDTRTLMSYIFTPLWMVIVTVLGLLAWKDSDERIQESQTQTSKKESEVIK